MMEVNAGYSRSNEKQLPECRKSVDKEKKPVEKDASASAFVNHGSFLALDELMVFDYCYFPTFSNDMKKFLKGYHCHHVCFSFKIRCMVYMLFYQIVPLIATMYAAISWHENRRKWTGDKSQKARKISKDQVISWSTTYEELLSTNEPFSEPIPLPEMVDFLVDIWHDDGLFGLPPLIFKIESGSSKPRLCLPP
ncbi:hypothetical protein GOBAR_AA37667 [Gossypium barbadense]|uniref:Gag1-like clamp domain-containing protein n=1 Tax=Gossypium barbadense TaxID=3634 RepID=A0A2P5VW34_GOSBA|nr:hypothetical protein GOBAR_AA37667 [Gossypium barbadense]